MDNASLQAFLQEYGSKTFCIVLDNAHKVLIGAPSSDGNITTVDMLQFKTFGTTDMFGVPHVDRTWGFGEIPYTAWMVTHCIQSIYATDELGNELPDLNKLN